MSTLPEHIILILFKNYSKVDKEVISILKEYFSGVPHIVYTDQTLYNSDTCYIVPYNNTLRAILRNTAACMDLFNTFGFATYSITSSPAPTFTKNIIREFFNFRYLPLNITIDPKYLETLKLLTED